MKSKSRPSCVTLTEMTVVAAVIALLVTFGLPAIRTLHSTFESGASVRAMISAGLASARAIAASQQRYAGIRFQQDLDGHQYMVFIMHDIGRTGYANGFRAVEGLKPIKLPDLVGVMDLYTRGVHIIDNGGIGEPNEVRDATTFSIVFSPSGKLVTHDVRVFRGSAGDPVFNDLSSSDAMFQEDSYNTFPYWQELSRNSFITYDKKRLDNVNQSSRWSDYLVRLVPIYINAYTGTIILVD